MYYGKYLLLLVFSVAFFDGLAQEITIHPTPKIDTVWYSDVTEDSEPKAMSCEENSIGYFRLKFNSEIVIDEFKKDTIKTKKEDWEKEDEEAFDEEYNKEKKEELEELENEFIEEDEDIASQAQEELDRFIDINWNSYTYSICEPDCESVVQQCYIKHEITQLKDYKKTYKYRTSYSWLEDKNNGNNEVEIEFDLVISYEAWIYFFVTCRCDDIPDLITVPTRQLNDSNPWAHIDVLGERMKPGYPFAVDLKSSPLLPIIGGMIGGGGLIYLFTGDDEIDPCSFTSTFQATNTKCGDQSGSAQVVLSPPGDYTFEWSSGQITSSINNAEAGKYTVTVTPSGAECPKTIDILIGDDNETISNNVTTTNSDCGKSNGTASIETPSMDQNYTWSDGSTGTLVSGLPAGDYSVTSTKGTCSNTFEFVIAENEPVFDATSEINHPSCGQSDGSISVSVNPQGEYQYQWSNGESGPSISELQQGSYTVTVTESGNECSIIESFTLEDLPVDFTLSTVANDATCGASDGGISVAVDPPGSYTYQWSNGETTANLSDQPAGEYSVTVTLIDSDCFVVGNASIGDLPVDFELNLTTNDATCGASDGSVSVAVDPPGSYTYQWSNGESTANLSDQPAGEYTVTVTLIDSDCSIEGTASIGEKPFPLELDFINTNPNCGLSDGGIILQLTPEGSYTFEWTNGQIEQNIKALPEGEYGVTITDQNGCTASGTTLLEDKPIIYIEQIESSPGDCINSGEITISLITPGDGPIVTIISGPNSQETFSLNSGTHDLSSLTELLPGNYSIEIYDQNAGVDCNQIIEVVVEDNTPALLAEEDNYEIESGDILSGDVLENDNGLNISVNSFFDEFGGTAIVNSDGMFQFIPDDDFEGEASFMYVIEDACGGLDTALVTIIVNNMDCTFTAQFEVITASCGLEDGHAFALVEPAGNYNYLWSDGTTGSELGFVASGTYGLSITDSDLGCELIFEVIIPENDPSYVSNIIVFQPSCSSGGEIQFELVNTPGPFLVTISHPGGIDAFLIPSGTVLLSDYLPIIQGEYTISVYDNNSGPECSETFSVVVEESLGFIISVIEIIPPSSISANDGAIIIEVTSPSTPPYTIWLNGVLWDITTENEFIISDLAAGEYSIFLTDVFGCTSNVVDVFVPPPMTASFNIGIGLISSIVASEEPLRNEYENNTTPFLEIAGSFQYLEIKNTSSIKLFHPNSEVKYALISMMQIGRFRMGEIDFILKGGGMINHVSGQLQDPVWAAEFSGKINLTGPLSLDLFISKSGQAFNSIGFGIKVVHQSNFGNPPISIIKNLER